MMKWWASYWKPRLCALHTEKPWTNKWFALSFESVRMCVYVWVIYLKCHITAFYRFILKNNKHFICLLALWTLLILFDENRLITKTIVYKYIIKKCTTLEIFWLLTSTFHMSWIIFSLLICWLVAQNQWTKEKNCQKKNVILFLISLFSCCSFVLALHSTSWHFMVAHGMSFAFKCGRKLIWISFKCLKCPEKNGRWH